MVRSEVKLLIALISILITLYIAREVIPDVDSHYSLLGVWRTASAFDVKRAFKAKSLLYHPDKFVILTEKSEARAKFQQITAAYKVLKNAITREKYDAQARTGTPGLYLSIAVWLCSFGVGSMNLFLLIDFVWPSYPLPAAATIVAVRRGKKKEGNKNSNAAAPPALPLSMISQNSNNTFREKSISLQRC